MLIFCKKLVLLDGITITFLNAMILRSFFVFLKNGQTCNFVSYFLQIGNNYDTIYIEVLCMEKKTLKTLEYNKIIDIVK